MLKVARNTNHLLNVPETCYSIQRQMLSLKQISETVNQPLKCVTQRCVLVQVGDSSTNISQL